MSWSSGTPQPTVSIVMTLLRHRGHLARAIESWGRQEYPDEKIDLVLIGNGSEPRIEQLVLAELSRAGSPRGRLFYLRSDNEMELYDFAARQARGEWLLFTEPHCLAQPDCLAELIGALLARKLAGGCARSLSDESPHRNARIEERMYREDAAQWTREGDWRKFTKRGFAVRAEVFREVGGFEHRYERFSELAIAARLHAGGYSLGYVPAAAVKHYNSINIADLFDYVWEFRRAMCAYADECDDDVRPYFAAAAGRLWTAPPIVVRSTRRSIRSALLSGLRRCHTRSGRWLVAAMLREAIQWRLGPAPIHAARYWLARLRFAQPWLSDDGSYHAFLAAWNRLGDWAAATYEPKQSKNSAIESEFREQLTICPGEITEGLFGFHAGEQYQGRPFRWTSPVASLLLNLPPDNYDLSLDTGGLRAMSPNSPVYVFFNGRRIGPSRDSALLRIPRRMFAPDLPQVLTFTCSPLPTPRSGEQRSLGLPLFGLSFQPAVLSARQLTEMAGAEQRAKRTDDPAHRRRREHSGDPRVV